MATRLGQHLMGLTDTLRFEPVTRRIRASLDGRPVLDTTDAVLVWEPRRVVPMYAVPPADIVADLVPRSPADVPEHLPPVLGPVNFAWHHTPGQDHDVVVDGRTVPRAAFAPEDPDLGGRVVVEWAPFAWVEEAHPVTGHPHDPFKRIDLLPSDRHVVVGLGGTVLADTRHAIALHETHIPARWYVPHDDVVTDLLVGSPSTTTCAYKGHAVYVSIGPGAIDGIGDEGEDIAWTYTHPLAEVAAIKGMVCFYAERTDLELDGVAVPRPVTPWSSPRDQERS
ncbi:MAG TPA: DUF427 domain-containing protein [Ornithinibacter sp.]|nr:DUF427 domain-containing protein [Ornithinibacter sp.]